MKILVIDDDPQIAEVVTIAFELQWADAKVVVADSGESGLSVLERENPHLVILDIGLPGIDGFEVLKVIRSKSMVPVIMLTVRSDEEDVARALDLGADDYLTKPFSHLVLLARAQSVLRRYFVGSRSPVHVELPSVRFAQ